MRRNDHQSDSCVCSQNGSPSTITWSLSLHVPDGCCSTAYFCSVLLWCSTSILHLHDHLRNVNGLIDVCASMITGADLCRECSQFAWPVARTRRKLFSSAMPIFPSVAGCYHFASITVLAIVHLTRRMHLYISLFLKCCNAAPIFSVLQFMGLKRYARNWVTWIFLFLNSPPKFMQTCVILHISLSFVPKFAIKAFLWIHNPSEFCHCIFFSCNTTDCLGCYDYDVLKVICMSIISKAYALSSWLDHTISRGPFPIWVILWFCSIFW